MRLRLLSLIFVFAGVLQLSQAKHAADLCGTPDFAQAFAGAEVIFSGKITKVERTQTQTKTVGEYVATFKVETWWKGTPAPEARVLWRSAVVGCDFFPVGEVGEEYLVYADPSKNTTGNQLPEVTIFSRTGKLPANQKSETILINDWSGPISINAKPTLNRADSSNDIKLLLALRECDCLSITHLPPPLDSSRVTSIEPNSQVEGASVCQTCLRRRLKPF